MDRSPPHASDVIELLPAEPVGPYVRQVARSLLRSLQQDCLPADALPLDRVDDYRAFSRRSRRQGLAGVAAALEDVDVNELSAPGSRDAMAHGRDAVGSRRHRRLAGSLLERQGHTVRDEDIRHIHPVHFEHINPFGHYRFDTQRGPAKGRLRPLRPATYTPRPTPATNATATNA